MRHRCPTFRRRLLDRSLRNSSISVGRESSNDRGASRATFASVQLAAIRRSSCSRFEADEPLLQSNSITRACSSRTSSGRSAALPRCRFASVVCRSVRGSSDGSSGTSEPSVVGSVSGMAVHRVITFERQRGPDGSMRHRRAATCCPGWRYPTLFGGRTRESWVVFSEYAVGVVVVDPGVQRPEIGVDRRTDDRPSVEGLPGV